MVPFQTVFRLFSLPPMFLVALMHTLIFHRSFTQYRATELFFFLPPAVIALSGFLVVSSDTVPKRPQAFPCLFYKQTPTAEVSPKSNRFSNFLSLSTESFPQLLASNAFFFRTCQPQKQTQASLNIVPVVTPAPFLVRSFQVPCQFILRLFPPLPRVCIVFLRFLSSRTKASIATVVQQEKNFFFRPFFCVSLFSDWLSPF